MHKILPEADTRTDLRMRQAYARRGLAMEVADLMTFTVHEKLVEKLFMEYQRDPPPGYPQVSLRQVAEADRRAWKMVAEKSNGDLGRDAAGWWISSSKRPLQTRPGGRVSSSKDGEAVEVEPTGQGKRKLMKENQKLKDQIRELKASIWASAATRVRTMNVTRACTSV